MYGYYEGIIELVRAPGFFTDEMEQEICTLRKQLEDGTEDAFPWERYEDLWYRKRLSSLPENYKSIALERLREIVKHKKENYTDIARALMIPITTANAGKHVKRLEALKERRDRLDRALETHKQLEALEQKMFVPESSIPTPITTTSRLRSVTIAELCISPFTPDALSTLLQSMGLLGVAGNCLTNDLLGKAQGKRSKFTAAYRVLHRSGLMDATTNDAEWTNSFKNAYDAEIGETARDYQLTAQGRAAHQSSKAFQKGVSEATDWVKEWKEQQSKNH